MARRPLRTLLTSKVVIGATTLALLGGGAALAADGVDATDGGNEDDELSDSEASEDPDDTSRTGQPEDPPADAPGRVVADETDTEQVDGAAGELEDPAAESEAEAQAEAEADLEDDSEDDSDGWALGRADDGDQQRRVDTFCAERRGEAAAAEREGGEDAESVGVPPFCEDGAQAPNAHGQATAEQARERERSEGSGPPEWAKSKRPDDVQPGPPAGVPRGSEDEVDDTAAESGALTPIEPADAPLVEGDGPPPHANARANRG